MVSPVSPGAKAEADGGVDDCAGTTASALLAEGCRSLDAFMSAFNSRDSAKWAQTLNYPHVRIAGGDVMVWQTPEDYARTNDLEKLAASGWHHSKWDWRHLVQSSDDKLHFTVQFSRYDDQDRRLVSYESFYIVTRKDGHWGVQARSSYAGVKVPGAAF
jgi:hypothetical protein